MNLDGGYSRSEFYRKRDRSEITPKEIRTIVVANAGLALELLTPDEGFLSATVGNISITYDPLHRALYLASYDRSEQGNPR
ncbi:MAG: hypothetical protein H0U23_16175 [Blastocatellia bacterium]|nr:hypothetical protein [Blastocatellia bacterium]